MESAPIVPTEQGSAKIIFALTSVALAVCLWNFRRLSNYFTSVDDSKISPKLLSHAYRQFDRIWCWAVQDSMPILPVPIAYVRESIEINGQRLIHTRYYPADNALGPLPCVLIRTPYGRDQCMMFACRFASRGYIVVVQDCRGRNSSKSVATCDTPDNLFEFIPVRSEGQDGVATIKWIEKQSWCNGSIGMVGGSYLGICQFAVIDDAPPSLKAIVPVNASSNIHSVLFPCTGGCFRIDLIIRWLYLVLVVRYIRQEYYGG
jgi:predicted acyl esterase